jgi:hypothetical protein
LNHHIEKQLKTLSNKVKDHRMRMHLLAAAHFKAGKNKADVARMLMSSRCRRIHLSSAQSNKSGVGFASII